MSFYDYVRDWLIEHLERDIESHEAGCYAAIGASFEEAPEWELCEDEIQRHRLGIAYNFWDMWMDARNHDWAHYQGMEANDWPGIARQICRGLRESWTLDQMQDNPIFQ